MIILRNFQPVAIALLACAALPWVAHAEGLQVAPVSVEIPERSGVVWLNNGSDETLHAQVRVFRWHQENGEDELVETEDLMASPPFAEIQPGGEQVIRLVRFGDAVAANGACERSYRIIVDELPSTQSNDTANLQYVLRYSVPVYLTSPSCAQQQPSLNWQIVADGNQAWLSVVNLGEMRAQLANVNFEAADGRSFAITSGLLGYVLPGATRRFALPDSAAAYVDGGHIEVQLNGSQLREPVSLATSSQ